jgi:hypothetical protein
VELKKLLILSFVLTSVAGCSVSTSSSDVPAKAFDVQAKANLRRAESTASVLYSDTNDFSQITAAQLQQMEPSLTFVGSGASSNPKEISTLSTNPGVMQLAAKSASGTCYYLQLNPAAEGSASSLQAQSTGMSCSAGDAVQYSANAWLE